MDEPTGEGADLVALLDELRIHAANGLRYADDVYDEDRYERILELVEQRYAELADLPVPAVRERFRDEMGHVTPKVGARAVVFDDEGDVLLVKRADDGTWGLPSGYVEPGEAPSETAVRETREETGLRVSVDRLVDVYTREASPEYGPHALVAITYLCAIEGGEPTTSHETDAVAYRSLDDVPAWHKDHEAVAREVYAAVS